MFGHYSDRDPGLVERREGDEQGMVAQEPGQRGRVDLTLFRAREHLRGSGLAADFHRQSGGNCARRAAAAVDHGAHAGQYRVPVCLGVFDAHRRLAGRKQSRRCGATAAGQCGRGIGQLQRSRDSESLADAGDQGFAGKPGFIQGAAFPAAAGQDAVGFARQVDAGGLTEAEQRKLARNPVDADGVGQVIEVGVDRLCQRRFQVDPAVAALAPVAVFARVAGQSVGAAGEYARRGGDCTGIQPGQGYIGLDRRAGFVASGEKPVEQRTVR